MAAAALSSWGAGAAEPPSEARPPRHRAHHARKAGLEARAESLSKALGLDARQQVQLRKILQAQREQVLKVRSDTSAAPALRVVATQAIADRTADRIRAMLSDDQKKKYAPPRHAHGPAPSSRSLEDWMSGKGNPR